MVNLPDMACRRLTPPPKWLTRITESASAGNVARSSAVSASRLRLTISRSSISIFTCGKELQKVSSARPSFTSALRFFDATRSIIGVSRSGVSTHTTAEQMIIRATANDSATHPKPRNTRSHKLRRGFPPFVERCARPSATPLAASLLPAGVPPSVVAPLSASVLFWASAVCFISLSFSSAISS